MLDANWGFRAEINHTVYDRDYEISLLNPASNIFTPGDFSSTSIQLGVIYNF
jgi:hypothetical protein